MIEAVIFDVDGLMIDTEQLHSDAHAEVIRNYGKEPRVREETGTVHIVGRSVRDNSEDIKVQYKIQDPAEQLDLEKHAAYLRLLGTNHVEPMPGLPELVQLLKENKIKMAIGSSGIREGINLVLRGLGMVEDFPVIISLEDITMPKPHPEIFLKAAEALSVAPPKCLVLEDSQSGIEAAKNAGMRAIAVPTRYTKNQDFSKADLVVNSLSDIKCGTLNI